MFTGTYRLRLDDKGRLFLPAKYRDALAEGLVMTKGQERCIDVLTRADYEAQASSLTDTPRTQSWGRSQRRRFFTLADELVPDRQGRVTVNGELRVFAGLDRDCAVVGVGEQIEIWDAVRWDAYMQAEDFGPLTDEPPTDLTDDPEGVPVT